MRRRPITTRRTNPLGTAGLSHVLPQIRALIEASRQHVVSTANLTLVWLYWNVGGVITEDIQKNEKPAGYGDQLIEELGKRLTSEYGQGFSARNLWDMKRLFAQFQILQAPPAELSAGTTSRDVSRGVAREIRFPAPAA